MKRPAALGHGIARQVPQDVRDMPYTGRHTLGRLAALCPGCGREDNKADHNLAFVLAVITHEKFGRTGPVLWP
jgi:hypothetical protein